MTREDFAALHRAPRPLVLFNVWDAGSARAVADAGAEAIATGSLSLAGAQGYEDGETIPFASFEHTVSQIAKATDLPLTVDFETGYAADHKTLRANARRLSKAGAIGCNLEDRIMGAEELRPVGEQCERIAAVAEQALFVNARTDLFLGPLMAGQDPNTEELLAASVERAAAYAKAGAGCFFVPGLSDPNMIARLCANIDLPVNVMRLDGMGSNAQLAELGVARISHGPAPWQQAMRLVSRAARSAFTE